MAIFRIRPGLRKRDPNPTSRRSLAVRCGARWRGRCKTSSCCLSRRCSAITARTPPGPHSVAVMKRIGNSRRTSGDSSPADCVRPFGWITVSCRVQVSYAMMSRAIIRGRASEEQKLVMPRLSSVRRLLLVPLLTILAAGGSAAAGRRP